MFGVCLYVCLVYVWGMLGVCLYVCLVYVVVYVWCMFVFMFGVCGGVCMFGVCGGVCLVYVVVYVCMLTPLTRRVRYELYEPIDNLKETFNRQCIKKPSLPFLCLKITSENYAATKSIHKCETPFFPSRDDFLFYYLIIYD